MRKSSEEVVRTETPWELGIKNQQKINKVKPNTGPLAFTMIAESDHSLITGSGRTAVWTRRRKDILSVACNYNIEGRTQKHVHRPHLTIFVG